MAGDEQTRTTKEPLSPDITDDQIQELKDERKSAGATQCEVVPPKGNKRFLVCEWPPL